MPVSLKMTSFCNAGGAGEWVRMTCRHSAVLSLFDDVGHSRGLLVECKPSFHSVFVSHQWLGKNHPDEKGSHSPALSMSAFPSSTWHASCG